MITAKLDGRRLSLAVETAPDEEAIPPFLVVPLSARDGRALSARYLLAISNSGDLAPGDFLLAFGSENMDRAEETLSQAEGELVAQAAFYWQTLGSMQAVNALLAVDDDGVQGGLVQQGKAREVFRNRMVPYLSQIKHHLESGHLTPEASTPGTATPAGGESSESKPDATPSEPSPSEPPESPTPSSSPPTTD